MTRFALLSFALLLGTPAAAQEQTLSEPAPDGQFDLAREKAKGQVVDCAGEKFVFAWGAGAHPTKVTLCGEKGATTDEIIRLIGDAADKIEATAAISEDRRTALVHQMRSKIAELQGNSAAAK